MRINAIGPGLYFCNVTTINTKRENCFIWFILVLVVNEKNKRIVINNV